MMFNLKALTSTILLSTAVFGVAIGTLGHFEISAQPKGIDVSSYQGNVDWNAAVAKGVSFAYIKATEGNAYKNPYFSTQYAGATKTHLIRGSYHFAIPDKSSGATQANWFASNGGGWRGDGITLPGALSVEHNPNGASCYGLNTSSMVSWIHDFSSTYYNRVGRWPVIYTTTDWWNTCTGNDTGFGSTNPLWIARHSSSVGTLPAGWSHHTFWQYANAGPVPGDQDYFNGDIADLRRLAMS